MSRLDDELRNALRREMPPEGFADRVLAHAAEVKSAWSFATLFRTRPLRWAVAGAMALFLLGAGFEYQQKREERARGEAARAQLMLALRITGSKLQFAQARVQQIRGPHGNMENVQ